MGFQRPPGGRAQRRFGALTDRRDLGVVACVKMLSMVRRQNMVDSASGGRVLGLRRRFAHSATPMPPRWPACRWCVACSPRGDERAPGSKADRERAYGRQMHMVRFLKPQTPGSGLMGQSTCPLTWAQVWGETPPQLAVPTLPAGARRSSARCRLQAGLLGAGTVGGSAGIDTQQCNGGHGGEGDHAGAFLTRP